VPLGRNFRDAEARHCATEEREERKPGRSLRNVFSLHLNTVKESLLRIVFGSMFQTARAEHPKTHVAKVVAMAGRHSAIADHRWWLCSRFWIRRSRYDDVDVLPALNVSRAALTINLLCSFIM